MKHVDSPTRDTRSPVKHRRIVAGGETRLLGSSPAGGGQAGAPATRGRAREPSPRREPGDLDFSLLHPAGISIGLFAHIVRVDRASVCRWISGRSVPHHTRYGEVKRLLDAIAEAVEAWALPVMPCASVKDTAEVMAVILKKYMSKEP